MRSTETIKVNPLIFRFKPEDEEKNLKIETQNSKLEMKVSVIKIRCKNGKNIENKKKRISPRKEKNVSHKVFVRKLYEGPERLHFRNCTHGQKCLNR